MKRLLLPVLVLSSSSYAEVLRLECSGELTVHPGVWDASEWPKPRSKKSDDDFYLSLTSSDEGKISLAIDLDSGDAQYMVICESDQSKCLDKGLGTPNGWIDFKEKAVIKPSTISANYSLCLFCFPGSDWDTQTQYKTKLMLDRLTGNIRLSQSYEQRFIENYDCLQKKGTGFCDYRYRSVHPEYEEVDWTRMTRDVSASLNGNCEVLDSKPKF